MLNLLVSVLLPPTSLVVLALILLLLGGRRSRGLATLLTAVVVLLAIPLLSTMALDTLAPPSQPPGPPPAAIVILAADSIRIQGPDELEPGPLTLDRLRKGAALARRTALPVLVSGGRANSATSLAAMMARSFKDDFGISVHWDEGESRDTWENARDSAAILKPAGITRIYLVTHFWHMRRALLAFRAAGLDPVPESVRQPYLPPLTFRHFLPRPTAWYRSYLAIHEWVGVIYYSLRQ